MINSTNLTTVNIAQQPVGLFGIFKAILTEGFLPETSVIFFRFISLKSENNVILGQFYV